MPELRCTVQTCAHNQQFYCDLDSIRVGGFQAKKAGDTSCDSFEERREGSCSNRAGEPSALSRIDCQATECCYNENCTCGAGRISVEGSGACQCTETECATFSRQAG